MLVSISMSVGNSNLSLVAALKDLSITGGASWMPWKFFIAYSQPSLFNVFDIKNSQFCFV